MASTPGVILALFFALFRVSVCVSLGFRSEQGAEVVGAGSDLRWDPHSRYQRLNEVGGQPFNRADGARSRFGESARNGSGDAGSEVCNERRSRRVLQKAA